MFRDKFLRAMKDDRIFLVPANHTEHGVTKVRVYLFNELNEVEPIDVEAKEWNNKFKYYTLLTNSSSLHPVFLLLSSICRKLGIDTGEIDKIPKIL